MLKGFGITLASLLQWSHSLSSEAVSILLSFWGSDGGTALAAYVRAVQQRLKEAFLKSTKFRAKRNKQDDTEEAEKTIVTLDHTADDGFTLTALPLQSKGVAELDAWIPKTLSQVQMSPANSFGTTLVRALWREHGASASAADKLPMLQNRLKLMKTVQEFSTRVSELEALLLTAERATAAMETTESFKQLMRMCLCLANSMRSASSLPPLAAIHVADAYEILARTLTQRPSRAKKSMMYYLLWSIRNPVSAEDAAAFLSEKRLPPLEICQAFTTRFELKPPPTDAAEKASDMRDDARNTLKDIAAPDAEAAAGAVVSPHWLLSEEQQAEVAQVLTVADDMVDVQAGTKRGLENAINS